MTNEKVLVIPTSEFRRCGEFHGFCNNFEAYRTLLDKAEFISRDIAETDPEYKQLVPYVVIGYVDKATGKLISIFQYVRGKTGTEGRLHGKRSIGIGGHIHPEDTISDGDAPDYFGSIHSAMFREIREEVEFNTPKDHNVAFAVKTLGFINDDTTAEGRVHLGVAFLATVHSPTVKSKETDLIEEGFMTLEELMKRRDEMESWSQLVLDALYQVEL